MADRSLAARRGATRAALAIALAVPLLGGCAAPAPPAAAPEPSFPAPAATPAAGDTRPSPGRYPASAATAKRAQVEVHDGPGGAVTRRLASPLPSGAPLTFLVAGRRDDWLKVHLPVRPNGSTGWVGTADVTVKGVPWRVDVHLGAHQLRLYESGRLSATYPIGVGTGTTPTPGGTFYLKELLRPPDPDGAYGPFAYGLSGFSATLDCFKGQDAVIGLHGTNEPDSIGRDVSHGCIRLRNRDITALAEKLPLGTPVRILG